MHVHAIDTRFSFPVPLEPPLDIILYHYSECYAVRKSGDDRTYLHIIRKLDTTEHKTRAISGEKPASFKLIT